MNAKYNSAHDQLLRKITTGIESDSRDLEGWKKELDIYSSTYDSLLFLADFTGENHFLHHAEDLLDDIEWMKDRIEGIIKHG